MFGSSDALPVGVDSADESGVFITRPAQIPRHHRLKVPPKVDRTWVSGDLVIISSKPDSIYLRGTILSSRGLNNYQRYEELYLRNPITEVYKEAMITIVVSI